MVFLDYLVHPIILASFLIGSILVYKHKTNVSKYLSKHIVNHSRYRLMGTKNTKKTETNSTTTITMSKDNTITKTKSISNFQLIIDDEPCVHIRLCKKINDLHPNHPDYPFIREVINNFSRPTYRCSNPNCRSALSTNGTIFNAFDVQFCSDGCRKTVSDRITQYWL